MLTNSENLIFHRDRGSILLPPKPQLTPEGFLRTYMRIAKVGELKYRNTDGTERVEVVSPEVLFSKQSMDSFKMKPITYPHPPVRVTAANAMQYQRGMLGHYAIVDGDFLGFVGTVTDKVAVDALLSGEAREASCGYGAPIRLRSDGKFDQIDRLGNHTAIVPYGRAGSHVRFNVDAAAEACWYQVDAALDDFYNTDSATVREVFKDIQPVQIWDFADRSDRWNESGQLRDENGRFAGGSGAGGGGKGGGGGGALLESATGAAKATISQLAAAGVRAFSESSYEGALATGGAIAAGALANKVLNRDAASQIPKNKEETVGNQSVSTKATAAIRKFVSGMPQTIEKVGITQGIAFGTRAALTHLGADPVAAAAAGAVVGAAVQPHVSRAIRRVSGVRSDDGEHSGINLTDKTITNLDAGRRKMRQISIKGEVFSIEDDTLADAIQGMREDADAAIALKAKLDAAEGNAVGLQSRVDSLQSELDAAQGSRMDGDAIALEVSARADAWNLVLPLLRTDAADFQPDYKLDVSGIHKLAIAKKMPTLKLDGKSAEFIQGVWASIAPSLSQSEQRADSSDELLDLVHLAQRNDTGAPVPSPISAKRKARSKMPAGSEKM